jgi:hypothetical protein
MRLTRSHSRAVARHVGSTTVRAGRHPMLFEGCTCTAELEADLDRDPPTHQIVDPPPGGKGLRCCSDRDRMHSIRSVGRRRPQIGRHREHPARRRSAVALAPTARSRGLACRTVTPEPIGGADREFPVARRGDNEEVTERQVGGAVFVAWHASKRHANRKVAAIEQPPIPAASPCSTTARRPRSNFDAHRSGKHCLGGGQAPGLDAAQHHLRRAGGAAARQQLIAWEARPLPNDLVRCNNVVVHSTAQR